MNILVINFVVWISCGFFLCCKAFRVELHNPDIFFPNRDTKDEKQPTSRNEFVKFSLLFEKSAEMEAIMTKKTILTDSPEVASDSSLPLPLAKLCFQINGIDCSCYDDIVDFSTYQFMMSENCKVDNVDIQEISTKTPSHVQPFTWFSIQFYSSKRIVSAPIALTNMHSSEHESTIREKRITCVLPLTLDDLPRAVILVASLSEMYNAAHSNHENIHIHVEEIVIIVPDIQADVLRIALESVADSSLRLRVLPESSLFDSPQLYKKHRAYPYAIQMALKLLVARFVYTPFYVTLDADIVLLQPAHFHEILVGVGFDESVASINGDPSNKRETGNYAYKGIYEDESRLVHPGWWHGSASLIDYASTYGIQVGAGNSEILNDNEGFGFSVTPAVLSSFGSILTLNEIIETQRRCHSIGGNLISVAEAEIYWIDSFGGLYRHAGK